MILRRIGSVLLILLLGAAAVGLAIVLALGAVLFVQRGAGVHLEDEPTPSMSIEDVVPDPLRPSSTPAATLGS